MLISWFSEQAVTDFNWTQIPFLPKFEQILFLNRLPQSLGNMSTKLFGAALNDVDHECMYIQFCFKY